MDQHRKRSQARLPSLPLLFIIAYDPLLVYVSRIPNVRSFAFADDLALFSDPVAHISPALRLISEFSDVSGLGVNKDKSVAVPTSDPKFWPAIQRDLAACPWPNLPLSENSLRYPYREGGHPRSPLGWPHCESRNQTQNQQVTYHLPPPLLTDALHERVYHPPLLLHRPFFRSPSGSLASHSRPDQSFFSF